MRSRAKSLHGRLESNIESEEDMFASSNEDDIQPNESRGWSQDEERTLLDNVKRLAGSSERLKFKTQLQKIDWDVVRFNNHSANDCKRHFEDLVRSVRSYRILSEIISDLEIELTKIPIKKPLSNYQCFLKDMANRGKMGEFSKMAKAFKSLSAAEKKIYDDQSTSYKAEYHKSLSQFIKDNPKTAEVLPKKRQSRQTPFKLFSDYNNLLGRKLSTIDMREEYNNLSLEDKYKWIQKSIKMYPNVEEKEFLNKEEMGILQGKIKKAATGYSLYVKDVYNNYKEQGGSSIGILGKIASSWRELNASSRQEYDDRAEEERINQKRMLKSFTEKYDISVTKKKRKRISNKKDSIVEEFIEEQQKPLYNLRTPLKKKKEKESVDNMIETPFVVIHSTEDMKWETPNTTPALLKSKRKKLNDSLTEESISSAKRSRKNSVTSNISSSDMENGNSTRRRRTRNSQSQSSQSDFSAGNRTRKSHNSPSSHEFQAGISSPSANIRSSANKNLTPKKSSRIESTPVKLNRSENGQSDSEFSPKPIIVKREKSLDINDIEPPLQKLPLQKLPLQKLPLQKLPLQKLPLQKLPVQKPPLQKPPLQKPPSTILLYYAQCIREKDESVAKRAFKKLKKAEKDKVRVEYEGKTLKYVTQMRIYLSSLPKHEAVKYIAKVREQEQKQQAIKNSSSSDESCEVFD